MTRPGIERRSPGLLVNTVPISISKMNVQKCMVKLIDTVFINKKKGMEIYIAQSIFNPFIINNRRETVL